jgi:hypothetical protein
MLQWDGWGPEPDAAAFVLLDEAARLTEGDVAPGAVRDFLTDHPELAVPPVVRSFSPAVGPREVALEPVPS